MKHGTNLFLSLLTLLVAGASLVVSLANYFDRRREEEDCDLDDDFFDDLDDDDEYFESELDNCECCCDDDDCDCNCEMNDDLIIDDAVTEEDIPLKD